MLRSLLFTNRYIAKLKYSKSVGICFHSLTNHTVTSTRVLKPTIRHRKNILISPSDRISVDSGNCLLRYSQSQHNFKNESTEEIDKTKNKANPVISQDNNLISDSCEENLFSNINYDEITGGDSEALNKFKLLLLEVDVLRQDGMQVPKIMSTESWKELFALESRSQRRKLLKFLWAKEIKRENAKRKREDNRATKEERQKERQLEIDSNEHINYGFQGNTIFVRVYDSTINHFDNSRLIQAMMYSENVVIDCGYDTNMTRLENKLCAKQLCLMFAENRLHKEPFNLHFCNFNRDTVLFNHFKKSIPTLDDPGFPLNITQENYLNLFPKDKLVYLTPHCRTELGEFNADDVYIIGALVDRHNSEPLSLAKAKSQGIRMAHLPLDRYLEWNLGTKSLTINQVLKIMLDIKTKRDWNEAMKHVPRRKIREHGVPVKDPRKFYKRGTVLQPPENYMRGKKPWKL